MKPDILLAYAHHKFRLPTTKLITSLIFFHFPADLLPRLQQFVMAIDVNQVVVVVATVVVDLIVVVVVELEMVVVLR